MSAFEIVVARGDEYLDDAALIWAQATAARDGDHEIAPVEIARPLIASALNDSPESLLLIARGEGESLGFAASAPVGASHARRAELRYFAVRPDAWGSGVAQELLRALTAHLSGLGYVEAELWVNQDNPRAADLYRRAGWQRAPEVRVNPRSGRVMERYVLGIAAAPPSGG